MAVKETELSEEIIGEQADKIAEEYMLRGVSKVSYFQSTNHCTTSLLLSSITIANRLQNERFQDILSAHL